MSAHPVRTIAASAAALAIGIGASAAQAQGGFSSGATPRAQTRSISGPAPAAPSVMAQPMSPWGPNTAQTIIPPVVNPVPYSPAFPTSPAATAVMTQPMSPWGPNTAQTIIPPVVAPVPYSPAFPSSQQPAPAQPPALINNPLIIIAPPHVTEFPDSTMSWPQAPAMPPGPSEFGPPGHVNN